MKHLYKIVLPFALLGFVSSCTEDTLDNINTDNQHANPNWIAPALQLTDAIISTGYSTVSGDYAFYLASLNEQEFGTSNNQLMRAELRHSSEWAGTSTFNNTWNATYGNLMNIRQMIDKINDETSTFAGQYDILGMAQVLEALNFGILTDMHGDIPYSQAVRGQEYLQPELDAQEEIYAGILATIDEAISNLKMAASEDLEYAGNQDVAFGNDIEQWIATAYALKARYLIHQLAVTDNATSLLQQVKAAAEEAAARDFKGFLITGFNGETFVNPWSAFLSSRMYTGSSTTVTKLMEPTNDPRLTFYVGGYRTNFGEAGHAYNPGDEAAAQLQDYSQTFPAWLNLGTQPVHMFSVHELYFILAEAQLRLGEDATEAFQTAVTASVSEILDWFEEDTSVASSFAASLGTPTLQTLFEQKYIAQCVDEQVETYNDLRRIEAMGESYITLTNPLNVQSGINRYPYCLPYGNSSVSTNPNLSAAYGDGSYIYTQKTWINGGN